MDLYFAPLACSMATRIALYEAGAEARFIPVDLRAKRLADGADFLAINPMGQVPVLRTDDGRLLRENVVILQHVAAQCACLQPSDAADQSAIAQWLAFVSTELHKLVFTPLLDPSSNDGARQFARAKGEARFAYLDQYLRDRAFLLDRFTVADAYLTTVLNWARPTGTDLARWPAIGAYFGRMSERPALARAMREEFALYQQELLQREKV